MTHGKEIKSEYMERLGFEWSGLVRWAMFRSGIGAECFGSVRMAIVSNGRVWLCKVRKSNQKIWEGWLWTGVVGCPVPLDRLATDG